jgi:hypothetical protein
MKRHPKKMVIHPSSFTNLEKGYLAYLESIAIATPMADAAQAVQPGPYVWKDIV